MSTIFLPHLKAIQLNRRSTLRSFLYPTLDTGGGCNCSRSNLAGALLGARFGLEMPRSSEEKDPTHRSEGKDVASEKFLG